MLAPVVMEGKIEAQGKELSATTWMPLKAEPSFTSMKVQLFESRRVRTHPCTVTPERGSVSTSRLRIEGVTIGSS
jgi:hypothetical protein